MIRWQPAMFYDDRDSLDGCLLAVLLSMIMLLVLIMTLRWLIGI